MVLARRLQHEAVMLGQRNLPIPRTQLVLGMLSALLAAPMAGLSGCERARHSEALVPGDDVDVLTLSGHAGTVELLAGDELRIERTVRGPEASLAGKHSLGHHLEGGQLSLTASCQPFIPCTVETRVEVPAGVEVHVVLGRGEVWATGVDDLAIDLGTGTVDLDGEGGGTARLGSGVLRATLRDITQARLAVADGDIFVAVDPTAPWAVETTGADVEMSGFAADPTAISRLELVAPSGRVRVRGEGSSL